MQRLIQQKCVPCKTGTKPLTRDEFAAYLTQVPTWRVKDDKEIAKNFKFKDFKEALSFVNQVGDIAESENHHPNIYLYGWNKVRITLTTHAIGGLSVNDFIMAAKIDQLLF